MLESSDNLFDPGVWKPALEKYAAVTRLLVHVYDAEGQPVEPWAASNPLAALFKERPYDPGLFEQCGRRCLVRRKIREPIIVEGSHGLAVVGTSLVLDGEVVGAAVAGYVLVDFTQVYGMHRLAAESGVSFERLWHVARLLAPVPKDRLMLHGHLLQALGDALLRENLRTRTSQHDVADLELAVAEKDEFLAVLSHELRNPLASLSSAIDVIEMTTDAGMLAQSRAVMRRQVGRLTRLVDDLLQMSRITQGKLQLQKSRIALAEVVRSAVEDTLEFVEAAGHELLVNLPEEPILVHADPMRLGQVFTNLLSNAAKYTPDGGRIEISAERRASGVRVTVSDNGTGIPGEKIHTLFQMFTQLDQSIDRGYRGLGIGLSLAKSLVEMQGGRIEARSDGLGKGSEFNVWLPVVSVAEASRLSSEDRAGASTAEAKSGGDEPRDEQRRINSRDRPRCRVLVVEDNEDAANSLATLLEIMGHEIRIARDGLEGVKAAAEFRPQLVLLDIGLPKLGGYDVARRIREESWGEDVTLAAVTGWGQETDRDRAQEAGFDQHLTKPMNLETLKDLLEKVALQDAPFNRLSRRAIH